MSTAATTEVAQLGSIQSAGDLTFHQGRLYVRTTNNQLAEITLSDTVEARVVGPLGQGNVLGMVKKSQEPTLVCEQRRGEVRRNADVRKLRAARVSL